MQHQQQCGSYATPPPLATGYHSPLTGSNATIMNSLCSYASGGTAGAGGGVLVGSGAATPVTLLSGSNNNNSNNFNNNNNNNNNTTSKISSSQPSSNGTYAAKPPFLREIVTIRTPLIFTQQESCV